MPYYEDVELGEKFTTQARTITDGIATQLISIGGYTVPFFNDEIAANKTPFGWRILPARMTFGIMGGLNETSIGIPKDSATIALVGVNNMKWPLPLKVGDTFHVEREVIELSETSNPRWGRVIETETLVNQKGEILCTADVVHLYERKQK